MEIQINAKPNEVDEFIKIVDELEKSGFKQTLESSSIHHYYSKLERASADTSHENSGLNIADVRVMCPECNQPYITYTADEYYECNSCDHTWI